MFEYIIKVVISIPIILTLVFSAFLICRVWNTQIDGGQSVRSWFGGQLSLSNWIVVRDKNLLYQNGKPVGYVEIEPEIEKNIITFPRIRYISYLDDKETIEFRRYKCNRIVINEIAQVRGMEDVSWFKNLKCEIFTDKSN